MHLSGLRFADYPLCLLGSVLMPHEDRLRVMCFNDLIKAGPAITLAQKNVLASIVMKVNGALRRNVKPIRIISIETVPKKFHRIQITWMDHTIEPAQQKSEVISLYAPSKKNKNKTDDGGVDVT
jgi:hypothetical protein